MKKSSDPKGQKSIAAFFSAGAPSKATSKAPVAPAARNSDAITVSSSSFDGKSNTPSDVRPPSLNAPKDAPSNGAATGSKRSNSQVAASDQQPAQTTVVDLIEAHDEHQTDSQQLDAAAPAEQSAPSTADRPRDPMRQALASRKLGIKRERLVHGTDDSSRKSAKGTSYTPLEQQVVDLKKRNPGKVLLVEVQPSFRLTRRSLPSSSTPKLPCLEHGASLTALPSLAVWLQVPLLRGGR